MGIGDRLLTPGMKHIDSSDPYANASFFKKSLRCPCTFTNDPIEYMESYINYKLRPKQKNIVIDIFSEDSTGFPNYDVALIICGMRGGKSILSGAMGSFLTHKLLGMEDPAAQLHQVPGQMLSAEFIATSEDQSKKTSYSAFCSVLTSTPWWKKYIQWLLDRETIEGKETLYVDHQRRKAFKEKNIEIVALHSNSASIAGLTAYYCAFDELSRFDLSEGSVQQQSEKRTAQAVYFTASRAIASVSPFSKIVVTTSPMYEADFGMQLLTLAETVKAEKNKSYIETLRSKISANDKVSRMVGYHYTTFEMNPKSDENGNDVPGGMSENDPYFKSVKKLSPATFNRDYLAIPPSAISPFFEIPERIEDCVIKEARPPLVIFENMYFEESTMTHKGPETRRYVGKRAFPQHPDKMTKYFICCDQGAVKDSFVIAMGHGEEVQVETEGSKNDRKQITRYKAVIDLVEAWIPDQDQKITVSFPNVEEVIRTIAGYFHIAQVVYDRWNSEESIQRLFSEGIYTTRLGATFQMYETLKLLIYSNMVELPKDNKLVMELRQLNNIKNRKIDHSSDENACFTGDTKIRLLNGTIKTLKELSELGPDNKFWVYSCLKDGTIVPAEAYNAHKTKEVSELVVVTLDNDEIIKCTPEHLFMLRNGDYIQAKDLKENNSLMPLYYKEYNHKVKSIEIVKLSEPIDVYDITVPGYDNFALASGIIVHNSKDKADSVCRVVWCIYEDCIKDTIRGDFMLPQRHSFSSLRSLATAFEVIKNSEIGDAIWDQNPSGYGGGSVFGKDFIVRSNVVPNLK